MADLTFTPMGGVGEIGMNLALYGLGDKQIAVDCGVTFADDELPGVDLIVPDISRLKHRKIEALIITHAHEDHLGAVPYLWRQLKCPVLVSGFAASILRRKLAEAGLEREVPLEVIPADHRRKLGEFDIEWVGLPHSIPEACGLFIQTPNGNVFHSGDWNGDAAPLIGKGWDEKRLAEIGERGVDVLICDSTNVLTAKAEGSEKAVAAELKKLIATRGKGRVGITFFASNIARMQAAASAALANGRKPIRVGRSMGNYEAAARENGYLKELKPFTDAMRVGGVPPAKAMYMLTGCQGEPRAALARVARKNHPNVKLERGDTVLFSARVIPGNEKSVGKIINALLERGIEVILPDDELIHVSGHPSKADLTALYKLLKPKSLIPVHGELRHLKAHSKLAAKNGIDSMVIGNGDVCRILPLPLKVVGRLPSGRKAVYQNALYDIDAKPIQQRAQLAERGVCTVSVVMSKRDGTVLAEPSLTTFGLLDDGDDQARALAATISKQVFKVLDKMPHEVCSRAKKVEGIAASCVRREFERRLGIRPCITAKAVYV